MDLHKHIEAYFGAISVKESIQINDLFHKRTVQKGAYFLKENAYCQELAFVSDGIFRIYTTVDEKEITQWLSGSNSFITEISSFLFNQSARWNIQALEEATIYSINKNDYRKLSTIIPRWTEMEKMFIAKCFAVLENRVFSHLAMNAEERYIHFSSIYPDIITQVPLQYLASMLGMTPETLSRIRKKRSIS